MKKSKIIATLGPASSSEEVITGLVRAGTNAFRINMSHGSHEQWGKLIETARGIAPHIPIIMDTKGPELRMRNVPDAIELEEGQEFSFSLVDRDDMPHLSHWVELRADQALLIDDGNIVVDVLSVEDNIARVKSRDSGVLTDRRKVTVPGMHIEIPIITEADKADLQFCMEQEVDVLAASFTQCASDIEIVRQHVGPHVMVLAKIENGTGIEHVKEIVEEADAVMVARGDLGVEIPLEEVPMVQKKIIRMCNQQAKPVVVATQMLDSMVNNNRPTRAEASDVANAILDGADCLMLSAETAVGRYPVLSVETMARIASKTDDAVTSRVDISDEHKVSVDEAISYAVYDLTKNLDVDAIITATASGFTTRMVSRFRPHIKLIGVAHSEKVQRQLQLSWGVEPCRFEDEHDDALHTVYEAVNSAMDANLIDTDDVVIATAGIATAKKGSTNLIEVHQVQDFLDAHKRMHGLD